MGAEAPKDDFGCFDDETFVGGGLQARCRAYRTVHIGGKAAAAADKVMVIVPHPRLIAGRVAGRLDAPDKSGFL